MTMLATRLGLLLLVVGIGRPAAGSEVVTIGSSLNARQPQASVDGEGCIHLTFGAEGRVFYTCSTDSGATYREPVEVGRLKSLALGMRRGPRIAKSEGSIAVTAIGGQKGGGRDGDLFAWRSDDSGDSWQGPFQVNDVTSSAREGLHGMAAAPTGDLFCVWLDLRSKGTQIFGSRSSDGGKTWSENSLIYKSPDGSVCECCHPSVVYDAHGAIHVMWRNSLAGNRDMFWATSVDAGKTFGKASKLGKGSWELDACPMDGGTIATSPGGKVAAVWRRDKKIFLTTDQGSDEREIGTGLQPWLAANERGLYTVWLTDRPGDLYFAMPGEERTTKLASGARDPIVAACSTGKGPVIVAWEVEEHGKPSIKVRAVVGATEGR